MLSLRKFSFLFFIAISVKPAISFSQQSNPVVTDTTQAAGDDKIYESVDIEASFSGGDDAWRKFLEKNIKANVPSDNGAPDGTYTVVVQFVVDKEGRVSDIRPLTHYGYGMEAEVIRILQKSPRWNPASQNGRMVKAFRKQPVTFMVTTINKRKNKNKG